MAGGGCNNGKKHVMLLNGYANKYLNQPKQLDYGWGTVLMVIDRNIFKAMRHASHCTGCCCE